MKNYIVIPTYNESENIERLTRSIFEYSPESYVLIVDDNSPDGTSEIVINLKKKFPNVELLTREKKEGLGKAYTCAFRHLLKLEDLSTVIMMDADFSHDPKYINKMHELSDTHDLVIGSRYIKEGGVVGWEMWRRVLSFGGNLYARTVLGLPIKDLTGGYNLISSNALSKIDFDAIDASGYAFLIELKHALLKAKARYVEVPIVFINRIGGESKISNHIIREGILAPWKLILRK